MSLSTQDRSQARHLGQLRIFRLNCTSSHPGCGVSGVVPAVLIQLFRSGDQLRRHTIACADWELDCSGSISTAPQRRSTAECSTSIAPENLSIAIAETSTALHQWSIVAGHTSFAARKTWHAPRVPPSFDRLRGQQRG
jgi:hypothetical protein